jgi:hypothetical protein
MKVCDPTDYDYLCASPYDVGLLRGLPSARIALAVDGRNRISMMIPTNLTTDVEFVAPVPGDLPGVFSRERYDRLWLIFLTAPVYMPNRQAIVFTKRRPGNGGWVILERRGHENWSIKGEHGCASVLSAGHEMVFAAIHQHSSISHWHAAPRATLAI